MLKAHQLEQLGVQPHGEGLVLNEVLDFVEKE